MQTPQGPLPPGGQQPPQPPMQPPQGYGGQPQAYGEPGMQDRATQAVQTVGRHIKTPETKEFFKTSEFMVWLLTVVAVLIAGLVISGGDDDELGATTVWTLVTVLSFGYIVSRGISKSGTRRGYGDAPMDRGYGGSSY